jgi:flavoprotein
MTKAHVLYIVSSGAPPTHDVADLLRVVRARGWDPCLTLTPTAAAWMDARLDFLASVAGRPVRTRDRLPGEPRPFPAPDAVLAAPVTFNTLNKWALGISDNVALGTLNEALGAGVPVLAVPWFKVALAAHPAYADSVARLQAHGVDVVVGADGRPDSGHAGIDWAAIAERLLAE